MKPAGFIVPFATTMKAKPSCARRQRPLLHPDGHEKLRLLGSASLTLADDPVARPQEPQRFVWRDTPTRLFLKF